MIGEPNVANRPVIAAVVVAVTAGAWFGVVQANGELGSETTESGDPPADSPEPVETNDLAERVLVIFTEHCAKCHDETLDKDKGDFGHVLDLRRMVDEGYYVVAGRPDESYLYELIFEAEMPKKAPPLSDEDVETVRQWIMAVGAVTQAASGSPDGAVQDPPAEATDGGDAKPAVPQREARPRPKRGLTGWPRLVKWLGNFHPTSVHFPIALLLAAAVAELFGIGSGGRYPGAAAMYCCWLGAIAAWPTALLGWANAGSVGSDDVVLGLHRWMGTAVLLVSIVLVVLAYKTRRNPAARRLVTFRAVLVVAAVLVMVTGALGGMVAYGVDHYAW